MSRDDPDFAIRDLYNAIAKGDFPSYTMFIQVMTFAEAEKVENSLLMPLKMNETDPVGIQFQFNPFDLTMAFHFQKPESQVSSS